MTAGTELLSTPQPHLIPGYAGYCPQYRYRCGETYGSVTHKILLDPTINHAETLILSSRATDDYEATRPPKNDIDTVNARFKRTDPIYTHPMLPGYEGFVPNFNARNGQRFSVLATEGIADFERQQLKNKAAVNRLKSVINVQSGKGDPRNLKERLMVKNEFKLPMIIVRPDCVGVVKYSAADEQREQPRDDAVSPYFMSNDNPKKYFISRYAGHVPGREAHFGASNASATNSALCEFTKNYRERQRTEWAPVMTSHPDPPLFVQSTEIYHKHVGLLPNYSGHVPGETFR